ncbi:MAG: hypothetical protein MRY83_13380 [Flavobacteriales bacterium]|nr:hypothetical protein [Flavobacteriales bacterium]
MYKEETKIMSENMNYPTKEEILNALQKSGYLFEQDVATEFEKLGYHVDTNYAYNDTDTDKSREIDVRAFKQIYKNDELNAHIYVEILVECKNSETPLVFIEREKNKREQAPTPKEYIFPFSEYHKRVGENKVSLHKPFQYLNLSRHHYHYKESNKATQFAKIFRKGRDWVANHEGIYDSLILPQAKLLEYRKKDIINYCRNDKQKVVWLFFPVVVLKDYLYSYDLTKDDDNLTEKKRISFVRNLDAANLKGSYLVDFITFGHIKNYIQKEVEKFSGSIASLIEEDKEKNLILNRESR